MSNKYIEPERLKNRVDSIEALIQETCKNDVKYLRSSTIDKYRDIANLLQECSYKLNMFVSEACCDRNLSHPNVSSYNIMKELSRNIATLNSEYPDIQEFCINLKEWFNRRYGSLNPNKNFTYTATRIPEFIDKFIIAYGMYAHKRNLSEFYLQLNRWYDTLESSNYPLPQFIARIEEECLTPYPESVVIEDSVKKSLYTSNFSEYHRTILDRYLKTWEGEDFLSIESKSIMRR